MDGVTDQKAISTIERIYTPLIVFLQIAVFGHMSDTCPSSAASSLKRNLVNLVNISEFFDFRASH